MFDNYMTISVPKHKNNQYRRGHISTIARSRKLTCPITITEKLLLLLPNDSKTSSSLVRRVVKSKCKEQFHHSIGIFYSCAWDNLKAIIAIIYPTHLCSELTVLNQVDVMTQISNKRQILLRIGMLEGKTQKANFVTI